MKFVSLELCYRCVFTIILLSLTQACATQPGTIFRTFDLEEGNSVTTDSRQRIVTNTEPRPTSRPGLVHPRQIICAEPSPDVAIAVANSFGAGLSVLGYGSGAVSGSQAEGIAQLAERTVTVQLLRDQMYRACESYANGAISATTYTLLMSKNNDAMVTLMLGETAGGAFGRSLAAIGGGANAEATATLQGLATATDGFKEGITAMTEANQRVAAAKVTVADKEKLREEYTGDDQTVKTANDKAVSDAKAELADAEAERKAIAESLQAKSEAVAKSAAEVKNLTPAGAIANRSSPQIAAVLAKMQKDFLDEDFVDEYVSACVVELGLTQLPKGEDLLMVRDAIDAYQNAQLDARGIPNQFGESPSGSSKSRAKTSDERLATAIALAAQVRQSSLADNCRVNLIGFMNNAAERNFHVDFRRLQNEQVEAQGAIIKEFNAAQRHCGTLQTTEQQAQCRNSLAKLIDPTAQPAPVPTHPQVKGGLILPSEDYKIAVAANSRLPGAKELLRDNPVPQDKAGDSDDRKAALKKLRADREALTEQIGKVDESVSELIKGTEKLKVETLTGRWDDLEVQRRIAETEGDALELKRYNAELVAQQAEAAVVQRTYLDLARAIESAISAVEAHIAEITALNAERTT